MYSKFLSSLSEKHNFICSILTVFKCQKNSSSFTRNGSLVKTSFYTHTSCSIYQIKTHIQIFCGSSFWSLFLKNFFGNSLAKIWGGYVQTVGRLRSLSKTRAFVKKTGSYSLFQCGNPFVLGSQNRKTPKKHALQSFKIYTKIEKLKKEVDPFYFEGTSLFIEKVVPFKLFKPFITKSICKQIYQDLARLIGFKKNGTFL